MDVIKELCKLKEETYGDFIAKLTPTVPRESIIGVRSPEIRKLAKEFAKEKESEEFLSALPHRYYEENLLHSHLLCLEKDYGESIRKTEQFLPYIDNWAVSDTLSPKGFAKNKKDLIQKAEEWTASPHTYTCRFGVGTLMRHFLDGDFKPEYLEIPAGVKSEEYYVNMMIAWYYATALAKQWDDTIPYLEKKKLSPWIHRKTIQKARESFRITPEQKEYLNSLK